MAWGSTLDWYCKQHWANPALLASTEWNPQRSFNLFSSSVRHALLYISHSPRTGFTARFFGFKNPALVSCKVLAWSPTPHIQRSGSQDPTVVLVTPSCLCLLPDAGLNRPVTSALLTRGFSYALGPERFLLLVSTAHPSLLCLKQREVRGMNSQCHSDQWSMSSHFISMMLWGGQQCHQS